MLRQERRANAKKETKGKIVKNPDRLHYHDVLQVLACRFACCLPWFFVVGKMPT